MNKPAVRSLITTDGVCEPLLRWLARPYGQQVGSADDQLVDDVFAASNCSHLFIVRIYRQGEFESVIKIALGFNVKVFSRFSVQN